MSDKYELGTDVDELDDTVIKNRKYLPPIAITKRIVGMAIFSTIGIAIRLLTTAIPGVEFVSFLILSYAFFLPLIDSLVICFTVTLIATLMTGFGPWYVVQFIYYPLMVIFTRSIRKVIFNQWIFGIMVIFFTGPWVVFWYFISDLLLMGLTFAIANVFAAIPIAIIQMSVSFASCIALMPLMSKVMETSGAGLYEPYTKLHYMQVKSFTVAINWLVAIILIAASIVCTYFMFQASWYFVNLEQRYVWTNTYKAQDGLLPEDEYLKILNSLDDDEIAIVCIYQDMKLVAYDHIEQDVLMIDEITNSESWVEGDDVSFYFQNSSNGPTSFLTGTRVKRFNEFTKQTIEETWGGDYETNQHGGSCPYILKGSNFLNVGAGLIHLQQHAVYQFSYDFKSAESHQPCTY